MRRLLKIPFVTREMDFCCRNFDLIDEILDRELNTSIGRVTEVVATRGKVDAERMFKELESRISSALRGIARVKWVNMNRGANLENRGRIYLPMGPMRQIGSFGFILGWNETSSRFFGWLWPARGGLDGRRDLTRRLGRRIKGVYLHRDAPQKLPGIHEDCGLIWLDLQFRAKTTREEIFADVSRRSKRLFRLAKPMLKKLVNQK